MKIHRIKVAIIMGLGLASLNQVQAQQVVSTVRAYHISADTDATGGEPIRFFTRNRAVAFFADTGIGFQTTTNFEQPSTFSNTATFNNTITFEGVPNFNRNAHFNAETFFNGRIRASSIGIGINPQGSAIHIKNNNIRIDGGQYQSFGPVTLRPDTDRTGDDVILFKNSTNEDMARLQDGILKLNFNSRIESDGPLNLQGSLFSFKGTDDEEQARLENGKLTVSQIRINVTTFPDYVFANDYNLMPLKEVDAYIKKYKHLPNVPTEADIVKKGMNVGQINTLLVEKVEELTLYTIQQEKQIQQLLERITALENKN